MTNGYIEATVSLGNPLWRVTLQHVLPNVAPPLLLRRRWLWRSPSWLRRASPPSPGLAIFLIVMAFVLPDDGRRDAFDPRAR